MGCPDNDTYEHTKPSVLTEMPDCIACNQKWMDPSCNSEYIKYQGFNNRHLQRRGQSASWMVVVKRCGFTAGDALYIRPTLGKLSIHKPLKPRGSTHKTAQALGGAGEGTG